MVLVALLGTVVSGDQLPGVFALITGLALCTLAVLTSVSSLDFASSDFKNPDNRRKFNECALRTAYYTITTCWGIWIAVSKKFDATVMTLPRDIQDPDEAAYIIMYSVQIGFYLWEIGNILLRSSGQTDIKRLVFHHFLTLFLILCSLYCGFWRIGFLVLLLHDASDIALYAAKATQYHFRETGRLESLVTLLFGVFVLGFIIARIVLFPALVIAPAAASPQALCSPDSWGINHVYSILTSTLIPKCYLSRVTPGVPPVGKIDWLWRKGYKVVRLLFEIVWVTPLRVAGVAEPFCITLALACGWGLCALFVLQLSWLFNIVAQVFKVKEKGIGAEDVRSDGEEDEEDEVEERERE